MILKTLAIATVVVLTGADSFAQGRGGVRERVAVERDKGTAERRRNGLEEKAVEARAAGTASGKNTTRQFRAGPSAGVVLAAVMAFPFQAAYARTDVSPAAIESIVRVEKRWNTDSVFREILNPEFAEKCARPVDKDPNALTGEAMSNLSTLSENLQGTTVEEMGESLLVGMTNLFRVSEEDIQALAAEGVPASEAQLVDGCRRVFGVSRPTLDDKGCPIFKLRGLPRGCAAVAKYVVGA